MIAEPPLDAPDDDWLVWADAMQEAGDPRGELLALGHAPAFVRAHAEALFGPKLGRHIARGDIVVTRWRRYLADELELRVTDQIDGAHLVADTLLSASAATLRGLAIAGVASPAGDVNLVRTLGWLRESELPPSLISLALIDDRARAVEHLLSRTHEPGPNLVDFGPLHELWLAFAQIEHLKIVVADPAQVRFYRMNLPNLRSLTFHALCWTQGLGALLSRAAWPALRAIELRCCDSWIANNPTDAGAYRTIYPYPRAREPVTGQRFATPWVEELTPLFEALAAHRLERVALTSFDDADAMLHVIEHVLQHGPRELVLDDSAFDTPHAERLARHPMFARLRRLSLARVKLPSAALLEGRGPEVVHSCRPQAPTYRYVVAME